MKIIIKNSKKLSLVGNLEHVDYNKIIIMSHGFTGNKSEFGSFDYIFNSFVKAGFTTLAFDFSGCGESDNDTLTVQKQVNDLRCVINYANSKGYKKIGLFGYSLGGLISLKCYNKNISSLVLWAPVTSKKEVDLEKKYSEEQLLELKEKGYITKTSDKGLRKEVNIDGKIFEEFLEINQDELMSSIKSPLLIIHGDEDKSVPLADSKRALEILSENIDSKLVIIKEGSHYLKGQLDLLIYPAIDWFKKYL